MTGLCCRCQVRHDDELCCVHGIIHATSYITERLDIRRVGSVVYSVALDVDGTVLSGPLAICDHCGALDTFVTASAGSCCTYIDVTKLDRHECPPVDAPLPPHSVCARRPCARCRVAVLVSSTGSSDLPLTLLVAGFGTLVVLACAVIGYGDSDVAKIVAALVVVTLGVPIIARSLRLDSSDHRQHPAAWRRPTNSNNEPKERS